MDDDKIKELFRSGKGNPKTKMELDLINVAAAANGGKVFIDGVEQANSPINDGRRSHIDKLGVAKSYSINLAHSFFDDFLGTAVDTNNWGVSTYGGTYSVSDSYVKMHIPAISTGYHVQLRRTAMLNSAALSNYKYAMNFKFTAFPTSGLCDSSCGVGASHNDPGSANPWPREWLLVKPKSGTLTYDYYIASGVGVSYSMSLGTVNVGDVLDLTFWHYIDKAVIIAKLNGVEVVNTQKDTYEVSTDMTGNILTGSRSSEDEAAESWVDWYKEGI